MTPAISLARLDGNLAMACVADVRTPPARDVRPSVDLGGTALETSLRCDDGGTRDRTARFNAGTSNQSNGRNTLPLSQTQMIAEVAERAQLSKSDAKRALTALDEIVLQELSNAQKVRIGGLVQLTVRVKPAQKKRKGRNPATGEEIAIAAKPASVDLKARPLAKAKTALPTVQKARRRLAA